ncbi:hypothetical protein COCON_G00202160, partial [Conger conger]
RVPVRLRCTLQSRITSAHSTSSEASRDARTSSQRSECKVHRGCITMSTLLDLKSSVLRQVQRSQSLRGSRDPAPQASSPLTHCPESTTYGTGEGNGKFFKRMENILQKQETMERTTQTECEGQDRAAPPPECPDQPSVPERISRRELDLLYEEAVYTVVNRVGVPSPEYITNEGELFSYLQKVFDIGAEEHDIILQRVQESKRATFSLRVSVMKGKNLLAKDANEPHQFQLPLLPQCPSPGSKPRLPVSGFRAPSARGLPVSGFRAPFL